MSSTIEGVIQAPLSMKETGFTEVALRTAAKVFAAAGLLALLFWLGWGLKKKGEALRAPPLQQPTPKP